MSQKEGSAWAAGWIAFAVFMMIMLGAFHAIAGLVGLVDDQFYVTTQKYVFQFDRTTWGWIHLILGIVVAFAGFAILSGQVWARAVGIGLAVLSAINNFFWLPYSPVWSFIAIGLAVLVIWALSRFNVDTV